MTSEIPDYIFKRRLPTEKPGVQNLDGELDLPPITASFQASVEELNKAMLELQKAFGEIVGPPLSKFNDWIEKNAPRNS